MKTVTLGGLPGTDGSLVDATFVGSRTAAIKALRNGEFITAAGDNGALNVWVDDDGKYRCEFMRHLRCLNSSTYRHLAAVDAWLREWMPKRYEGFDE